MELKYKGSTTEVQRIRFVKGSQSFKGSEIDRSFSYSKPDVALKRNHTMTRRNDIFAM